MTMSRRGATAYSHVSTHTSLEEAIVAVHSYDAFGYVTAYNYGAMALSSAKVYRCISHKDCARRLRVLEVTKEEEEIPVTFQLAVAGEHGTEATNKKRVGIDLAVKGEVDALLANGTHPRDCRSALQRKYADQPPMLAKVPDEGQLKNRLMTLRKHGWQTPEAGTAATPLVPTRRSRKRRVRDENSDSSEAEMCDREAEGEEEEEEEYFDDTTSTERQEETEELETEVLGEQFDKEKLIQEFTEFPGRPVLWTLLKNTRYYKDKNEDVVTEWLNGQVIGWQTSENEPTKWVVKFADGDKRRLELEELVDEIRAAAQLGMNVTGKPLDF